MSNEEPEVYEKTARSTVNRYRPRAKYDHETIHGIIDSSLVLHVSFNPTSIDEDPFPTILPMLGCTGSYTADGAQETSATAIYLHGHIASRFMKLPNSPSVHDQALPGVPVCVAATHVDGIILAITPFNHSCNYRSAVIHGYATLVEDPGEKMYALKLMTDNMVPERWDNSRVPPTEAEMKSTGVIRVDIVSASAKIRAAPPGSDKTDVADEETRKRVWTGSVPTHIEYGTPVPAAENVKAEVPNYITNWISEENSKGEIYSRKIVS
ncbi:hypothetical protein CPC08DRAFT_691582 [Agrocybe pediades]|nr:hypothetical protein CPC08DRAFT_691582 [Agrocybe pediades]